MKRTTFNRRTFIGSLALGAALATGTPRMSSGQNEWPETDALPKPRFIETNGIRMAVYEKGAGFPVVFSHGFPELAYSWRHQLGPVADAGFHAIAPDQRGYGRTDRPEKIDQYTIEHLTGDLAGLLDALGHEKAVFCGHDWGGLVVWMMPLLHPDRVAGVIGVNTPFIPRSPVPPIQMMRSMRGENNYIVAFQEPGVADAILEKDVQKTFTAFLRGGGLFNAEEFAKLPPDAPERNFELLSMVQAPVETYPGHLIVPEEALDYYVKTFEKTGFTGGINWYRNIDRNWELTEDVEYKVEAPSLYIGAEDDVVLPPSMANGMERWVPNLEKHVIKDCGHWTQQEKPEELNRVIIDWLKRKFV